MKELTTYLTGEDVNEGQNEDVTEGATEALSGLSPTVRASYIYI